MYTQLSKQQMMRNFQYNNLFLILIALLVEPPQYVYLKIKCKYFRVNEMNNYYL